MSTRDMNLAYIATVARGLNTLVERVAFVGGATIALYIDDPTASDARVTDDVDCVVELSSLIELEQLEKRLRAFGFRHIVGEGQPVCRWEYAGVIVDIMPTDPRIFGFANRWYAEAMKLRQKAHVANDVYVYVFPLVYLFATKFEAFGDRGEGDWLASHDVEDIVALLDGASALESAWGATKEGEVRSYLQDNFTHMLQHRDISEILLGHLPGKTSSAARRDKILQRLRLLIAAG